MRVVESQKVAEAEIPLDIAMAVEALTELKNSHARGEEQQQHEHQYQQSEIRSQLLRQQNTIEQNSLLNKVRSNSLIHNAVKVYEQSKNQYPSFRKGAEMVERKALIPMVKRLEERRVKKRRLVESKQALEEGGNDHGEVQDTETELENDNDDEFDIDYQNGSSGSRRTSKKQKISDAIAKSKSNLKGYQLNMSIESKKRLVTCLHLLKLANYQLSNRVSFLQDLIHKEQRLRRGRIRENPNKTQRSVGRSPNGNEKPSGSEDDDIESDGDQGRVEENDDDEEEFYDASDNLDEQSNVVKMEIVGTVKKIYFLISKFTGNSLPEPARSQVRETLLKLPSNWITSMNSEKLAIYTNSKSLSPNGKILILAQESLGMVHNVMDVVDNTLGKAEEWVKHKQEIKELLKAQYFSEKSYKKVPK
ncbi:LADA_0G12530g1_1 [Lachancea dasiensis]|uniref:LADA_0G12530g1_1 n=1 Tax=Lachancea dasiensis TaxID=1072105 RepID=A0A1G4JVB4_9SACH|nr:LADA_0G12530g1_1 [Lachancea dasiensis]